MFKTLSEFTFHTVGKAFGADEACPGCGQVNEEEDGLAPHMSALVGIFMVPSSVITTTL